MHYTAYSNSNLIKLSLKCQNIKFHRIKTKTESEEDRRVTMGY